MPQPFFTYELDGAGWALATVNTEDKKVVMIASYLNDPLPDLCNGLLQLLTGAAATLEVIFMDEPGEHRFTAALSRSSILAIRIEWARDWVSWDACPPEEYDIVLQTEVTLQFFTEQLIAVLEKLLVTHGAAGYKQKWIEGDFPSIQLAQLKELFAKMA